MGFGVRARAVREFAPARSRDNSTSMPLDDMRTAFQLLLRCARSQPDVISITDLVNEGVNWQILLRLAEQHRVRPMLFRSLKSACWDAVPKATQLELERFNRANVQKNLLLTGELLRLIDIFEQNEIPIAAFKGSVLAESVYRDLSLREFCDVDIIVQPADVPKAEDILVADGYRAQFPDREFRYAFQNYQGQYAFRHGHTGIVIDLHWRLSANGVPFPLQSPDIWQRLDKVTIAGRNVPTLGQDDLALLLAAHGTKEGWRSLNWVCDFAELLRNHRDIGWIAVLDRAQRSHSSRSVLLAIALAATLLDAPAPAAMVDAAWNNPTVRALAEQAKLRMLRTDREEPLEEFLSGLNTHDRLRHRLWPLATVLITRTVSDYEAMPLPKSLWGLYHFTRPFRLAGKIIKMMPGIHS
jgi:Uncharacterised nucleotidyltransferase